MQKHRNGHILNVRPYWRHVGSSDPGSRGCLGPTSASSVRCFVCCCWESSSSTSGNQRKAPSSNHWRRHTSGETVSHVIFYLPRYFFSLPCFYIPVILLMIYMMFLSYSKIIILFLFFRKHRDDMTLDIRLNEKEKQNI